MADAIIICIDINIVGNDFRVVNIICHMIMEKIFRSTLTTLLMCVIE